MGNVDVAAQEDTKLVPSILEIEQRLAQIWKEVLEIDQLELDDQFLELGGQSLQAVLLLARVQEQSGVGVPFGTFLQAPTVRGLAAQIRMMLESAGGLMPRTTEEEGIL
jgi:tyrocidine synthetase III